MCSVFLSQARFREKTQGWVGSARPMHAPSCRIEKEIEDQLSARNNHHQHGGQEGRADGQFRTRFESWTEIQRGTAWTIVDGVLQGGFHQPPVQWQWLEDREQTHALPWEDRGEDEEFLVRVAVGGGLNRILQRRWAA